MNTSEQHFEPEAEGQIALDRGRSFDEASSDFRFAAAVASFGMLLRQSEYRGSASFDRVIDMAREARGEDRFGYRAEMIRLVKSAQSLSYAADSEGHHDAPIARR